MRIINLSYVSIKNYDSPESWLKRINYFTGILERLAIFATVINFHAIQYKGVMTRNGVEYHFQPLSFFEQWFPFSVHSYILRLKPDVIIVHGLLFPWQVFLLQWRLDRTIKLFIQHHAERPSRGIGKYIQRWADRRVQGYFFSSAALADPWVKQRLISDMSKVFEVMEVSSVFSPMDRQAARIVTGVTGSSTYLWVGNLTSNKDPMLAAKSFRDFLNRNPEAQLYLIFKSTELLEELDHWLRLTPGLEQSVHLVGPVEHDKMLSWFNSVDFILATSKYEGSGTAVCEAMSCGCIPILSDIPSFRMMTKGGNCGILFPPGNQSALVESLERSTTMDLHTEREKVLYQFRTALSFDAIAKTIFESIIQMDHP